MEKTQHISFNQFYKDAKAIVDKYLPENALLKCSLDIAEEAHQSPYLSFSICLYRSHRIFASCFYACSPNAALVEFERNLQKALGVSSAVAECTVELPHSQKEAS